MFTALLLLIAIVAILFGFTDRSATAGWTLADRWRDVAANLRSDAGLWSTAGASSMFRQFLTDYLGNTNAFWTPALPNLDLETHKVALYTNSVTPDQDCTAAQSQYGAGGTWTTGNESTGAGYTAGGTLLLSTTLSNIAAGITMWDANDTSWTTITTTTRGCLIYADALTSPVAKQGILFVYFGGDFTTAAGNLTIQWATTGLYRDDN